MKGQGRAASGWSAGLLLPSVFRAQNYFISAPGSYGLYAPPAGAQWVRVDNDALLVSNQTGQVMDVIYNVFY